MRKTLQEILFQPEAWQHTILAYLKRKEEVLFYLDRHRNTELVLTGCGTSYYLTLTAAALYTELTGEKARGVPASEIMLFPQSVFARNQDYLLIPVSRSGKTPETLAATRYAKEVLGDGILLISCNDNSEIANCADLTMICPQAAEETKYMTKSFTSMLLGFQLMTAWKSGNQKIEEELLQLPQQGEHLIRQYRPIMEKLAKSESHALYIYLGHGPMYGIAEESMLKLKEMACTPAEAYHGMELMHGPKYAVDNETLIFYLLSDSVAEQETGLLKRIKEWGGNIKIICEQAEPGVSEVADDVYELRSGLSGYARPVLVMLLTQLYAFYRALAIGKNIE